MGTRVWARPPLADSDSPHLTPPSIFPPPTSSPAALEAAVANFNGSFFTFLGEDVTDSSSRDSEREVELGPKKSLEDEYSDHFLESVNEGEWGGYRDGEGVEEEDEEESGEDTEDENQGAPSREPHYQLPPLHDFNHDINVNIIDPYLTTSPSSTTQHQEEPQQLHIPQQSNSTPFIPVLSRPRHAHPRKAYKNEDQSLSDYDEDLLPVREADDDGTFALPPLNHRPTSVEGSSRSKSRSSSPFSTRNKSKRKKSSRSSVSSSTVSDYQHNSNGGAGIGLRRTELPAVEDDPSIKPYGCNYPYCIRLNFTRTGAAYSPPSDEDASSRSGSGSSKGKERGDDGEETSFRTIRELREHCAIHRRKGERPGPGDTAFRCALDPCGKVFKSAAGLLWHFTNASAGHFFVSIEEGEDRPSKKFKRIVESSGRNEKCPVPGCTKAFKQAAGLAYHLAHAPLHPQHVSEQLLQNCSTKLKSKVRWWFAKLGAEIPVSRDGATLVVGVSTSSSSSNNTVSLPPLESGKVRMGIGRQGQWGRFDSEDDGSGDDEEEEEGDWADEEEN